MNREDARRQAAAQDALADVHVPMLAGYDYKTTLEGYTWDNDDGSITATYRFDPLDDLSCMRDGKPKAGTQIVTHVLNERYVLGGDLTSVHCLRCGRLWDVVER